MSRLRVLVLFGGRSGEHEVSVVSARAVVEAVERSGHELVAVGITREGSWVRWDPRAGDHVSEDAPGFTLIADPKAAKDVDVAFPVLHGPHGEDGTVQGFFELAGLAYVGAGVEGSAIGTNKAVHKRLFAAAGLPVVEFVELTREDWTGRRQEVVAEIERLGYPSFAKPARLGSSVGISKIADADEISGAVERALRHDELVLIEEGAGPREIEIAALEGPEGLELSVTGEIVPDREFYDYASKYRSDDTELKVPAPIPPHVEEQLRGYARAAFRAACCEGFARIDFLYDADADRLVVNEINTIPGLTPASMFPRLWEASGLRFHEVVDRLLHHALDRHARRSALEAARLAAHEHEVGG